MLVKELIEQEKGKYDEIFFIDTRNIVFPSKYLDYEVVKYEYRDQESQALKLVKGGFKVMPKEIKKQLSILGKKVGQNK